MPYNRDGFGPEPLQWPRESDLARRRPASQRMYMHLLDADDDLAEAFDPVTRGSVRQLATARVLEAVAGPCDLDDWFGAVGDGPGLLVLDGLFDFETTVGRRTTAELIGPGDLLQPLRPRAEDMLAQTGNWRALSPARLALLDGEFAERVRPWPRLIQILLQRAGRRIGDVSALRAITSHPRLEARLVLLFWHLAARWGRVEPAGIRLTLPLTHRLLGQLVGAERPSISHALHRLADADLVTGAAGDLHLHGTLEEHLEVLAERACEPPDHRSHHNGSSANGRTR